ncbi:aspartate carbamoyltransferase [Vibrio parahaemolyticus]|nr:aspartate carbamoyltransferase [Vibrio parahaemolyticus]EJG0913290.1 aspartate carbamoyltransferase [Vibrio parahaemolyticus]
MTKLIADVKTRFALTKQLRLRGVIFVNSIDF